MTMLSESEFSQIKEYIRAYSGINLIYNEKNVTLVTSRLNKHLLRRGMSSYREYLDSIRNGSHEVVEEFISSLTTNTTAFYREPVHFEKLGEVVERLMIQKQKKGMTSLRVWCSVSSSGQEAYTMLFTILESLQDKYHFELHFLASDIDVQVLQKARDGLYHSREVSSLSSDVLKKYFDKQDDYYQVKLKYRKMIKFARFNLIQERYGFEHKFDIVFCRNVLIYFQPETIAKVISNIYQCMSEDGYLFLGHSESGLINRNLFETHSSALYRLKSKKAA